MDQNEPERGWKLKLRHGIITTPFTHFALVGEGRMEKPSEDFSCPAGPAMMGMKVWAASSEEAVQMMQAIGGQFGFVLRGRVRVYDAEPDQPPRDNPYGYNIAFVPYAEKDADGQ